MYFKHILSGVFTALLVVALNAQSYENIMLKPVVKSNSVSINFIDENRIMSTEDNLSFSVIF